MESGADITCRKCGRRNSPGSRFCSDCGGRIDGVCIECGHVNEPDAKFCSGCGQGLFGEAMQAPQESDTPAPGANVCPRCLHPNEPGSQFCYHCGLPLEGEAARAAPRARPAFEHGAPGGFWVRVVAYIIDSIVVWIVAIPIYLLPGLDIADMFRPDAPITPALLFADFIVLVFAVLYSSVLISLWSTTVGKRAVNLYVVRSDGGRCSFRRALGRELAKILSVLTLYIGYLLVAFREDKRALHDLIADTVVIRR